MNSFPAMRSFRVQPRTVFFVAFGLLFVAILQATVVPVDTPVKNSADPLGSVANTSSSAANASTQDKAPSAASGNAVSSDSKASNTSAKNTSAKNTSAKNTSAGTVAGATPSDQSQEAKLTLEQAARKAEQELARRAAARAKGELTFDDLKFDIEKDGDFHRSMLTNEIEELDKRTVRIRGYILPQSVFKSKGFEEFVLVRDNQECCFGPGAAIYDCIMVFMEKGKAADFVTRPVAVKGRFEIKEFKYPDSEKHYAIYQLIASEVK